MQRQETLPPGLTLPKSANESIGVPVNPLEVLHNLQPPRGFSTYEEEVGLRTLPLETPEPLLFFLFFFLLSFRRLAGGGLLLSDLDAISMEFQSKK